MGRTLFLLRRAVALIISLILLSGLQCPLYASPAPTKTAPKSKTVSSRSAAFRLPESNVPVSYELSFEPDLNRFKFTGEESVLLKISKPVRELVMNSLELRISGAEILSLGSEAESAPTGGKGWKSLQIRYEPAFQKVYFSTGKQLTPGCYRLRCHFEGTLNNQLRGFYRVEYKDGSRKSQWLAATQMEPSDARRMFPCFDEPGFKAVFKIRAVVEKNHVALSNAPMLKVDQLSSGKRLVTFEPTPKMSSYLLALMIGDLRSCGKTMSGTVPIEIWAVPGREKLGKYALSEAPKILDFESAYFGKPYLGKKLDLIALPEFSAGAMENIGAVTFRDSYLLFDEKTGSSFQKQHIFGIMAHEFAHQWFGDLVTMSWWDDLWLNESFATWMTTKVEAALHPEWRSMAESVRSRYEAMDTDALKSSRPIHAEVSDPSQAVEMFDGITYSKGAAILRMLEAFIGEEAFRHGIKDYLNLHEYGNAVAENFWTAIGARSRNVPVAEMMRKFIYQAGYPQVNVKIGSEAGKLKCSQYRQLNMGQDKKDPSLWLVPLILREPGAAAAENEKQICRLLQFREQIFNLKLPRGPLFVNSGGRGYFKTCYAPADLKILQKSFSQLSAEEKIVLLSDCSSLVLPGDVTVEANMSFLKNMSGENDPLILAELVNYVCIPRDSMTDSSSKNYEKWVRSLLSPLKTKVNGWTESSGDSQQTRELRSHVLQLLGTLGQDKSTIKEAFDLFANYLKDRSSVNPDLNHALLSIVAYNGGEKEYQEITRLWKTAKNPADEENALFQLAAFRRTDLLRKTQQLAMSKEVKVQDGLNLLCEIVHNFYGRELGWTFIKENWLRICKRFPEEELTALASIAGGFDTAGREKEFRAWFASHPLPFGKTAVSRSLETLHSRVLFRQRYGQRIKQWVLAEASNAKDEI